MKTLVVLMILLSIFMGIPTNKGWFTLYHEEFISPYSMFVSGAFYKNINEIWILLLISHASVLSLLFLTKKSYFKILLYWLPFLFILIHILFDLLTAFFLIPFIIIWVIALFNKRNIDKWQNGKTSVL